MLVSASPSMPLESDRFAESAGYEPAATDSRAVDPSQAKRLELEKDRHGPTVCRSSRTHRNRDSARHRFERSRECRERRGSLIWCRRSMLDEVGTHVTAVARTRRSTVRAMPRAAVDGAHDLAGKQRYCDWVPCGYRQKRSHENEFSHARHLAFTLARAPSAGNGPFGSLPHISATLFMA